MCVSDDKFRLLTCLTYILKRICLSLTGICCSAGLYSWPPGLSTKYRVKAHRHKSKSTSAAFTNIFWASSLILWTFRTLRDPTFAGSCLCSNHKRSHFSSNGLVSKRLFACGHCSALSMSLKQERVHLPYSTTFLSISIYPSAMIILPHLTSAPSLKRLCVFSIARHYFCWTWEFAWILWVFNFGIRTIQCFEMML